MLEHFQIGDKVVVTNLLGEVKVNIAKKKQGNSTRERVYNFLVDFITKNGYSPSIKEICSGTGLKSTSSVYCHLGILEKMGKITM